ncbi:MAG: PAS domain S-box protein [Candidatus Hatepunaea meridiana]|nr:PAS domain S-box protein [Candidatus Hatepunaea meridiana]
MTKDQRLKMNSCPSNTELCNIRQEAMELAGIGVIRYKLDGTILFIDQQAVSILELENEYPNPNDVTGKNISDLFVYDYPNLLIRDKIIKQGELRYLEYDFKTLTGKEKWVNFSAYLIEDPKIGEKVIQVVLHDITYLKQLELLTLTQRDLSIGLSAISDLKEALYLCIDAAIEVSGMDCAGIYLVSENSELDIATYKGFTREFVQSASHYDSESPSTKLVLEGKPIYTRHQEMSIPIKNTRKQEKLRAIAVIPILHNEKVIACLNIASHTMDDVPDSARNALESIASRVGSAIARLKAEEALIKSEKEFRLLAESSSDIIWTIDTDMRFTYASPSVRFILGYTKEEMLSLSVKDVLTPASYRDFQKAFRQRNEAKRLETGMNLTIRIELELIRNDKTTIWTEVVTNPLRDEKSQLIGDIGIIRDITLRKQSEEKLLESEEKYRILIDDAPLGIYYNDLQGKFLFGNKKAEEIIGYKKEELTNKYFLKLKLLSPKEIIKAAKLLALNQMGRSTGPDSFVLKMKDGLKKDVEINTSLINIRGKKVVLGMVSDISKRIETEKHLKSLIFEKEALIKEVHHRVKNNFQIISSLLDLQSGSIKDKQAFKLFKESRNRIRSISLIHEKLYISENLSEIDFGDYIESLTNSLLYSFGFTPETVKFKINVSGIFFEIGTAIPCALIINELVTNSFKHAFKDNRNAEINILLITDNYREYTLIYADNGSGFPAGYDLRKPETLGLQLVNTLIKQIHGTIELENQAGAAFRITFPTGKYKPNKQ